MRLKEFNYDIDNLKVDFYGEAKIDVFDENELILEIDKVDDSIWVIYTHQIEENLVTIKKEIELKLIDFITNKIKEKFDADLPVILHPNFFMTIEKSCKN